MHLSTLLSSDRGGAATLDRCVGMTLRQQSQAGRIGSYGDSHQISVAEMFSNCTSDQAQTNQE